MLDTGYARIDRNEKVLMNHLEELGMGAGFKFVDVSNFRNPE